MITPHRIVLFILFLLGSLYVTFLLKQATTNESSSVSSSSSSLPKPFSIVSTDQQSVLKVLPTFNNYSNNDSSQAILSPNHSSLPFASTVLSDSDSVPTSTLTELPTKSPPPPSCHRVCNNQYRNVILLTNLTRAGWTDRFYMILATLQLAGYLCAKVWIPRPKFILSSFHNQNKDLSINVTWKELGDFQFVQNPSINNKWNGSSLHESLSDWGSPLVEWINEHNISELPDPNDVLMDPKYNGWLYVHTSNETKIYSDLRSIEQFTWNINHDYDSTQVGFIWRISGNYYKWKRNLEQYIQSRRSPRTKFPPHLIANVSTNHATTSQQNQFANETTSPLSIGQWQTMQPYLIIRLPLNAHLSEGCEYSILQPTDHVREIIDRIWKFGMKPEAKKIDDMFIGAPRSFTSFHATRSENLSPTYLMGYFHIRRNDAVRQCNTSLESISRYLNCSFDTLVPSLGSSGIYTNQSLVITVFLSSDESSTQYRQKVIRMVEQQSERLQSVTNARIVCIDIDKFIRETLYHDIQIGIAPERLRNNLYVYDTIFFLSQNKTIVQFNLEKRRIFSCPNCTNITNQILINV